MKSLFFGCKSDLAKAIALLLGLVVASPGLRAASGTWNNGASDNLWQTSSNWSASPFPGATSGFTSTDTAAFALTGNGTIDLGGTLNVQSISIGVNGGNASAFTIGDATDTLNFTSGGSITVNSGVTANETIGTAGSGIINTSTTANSTYSFLNNGQGTLTVSGNVTANQATGSITTLTLGGVGNGNVSGAISGGGTAGAAAIQIVKNGSGTWTLGGTNTYASGAFSGGTTVNGGKLVFNYTTNVPIAATSRLMVDNGAVTFKGKASGSTTVAVGNLWLSVNPGTANTLTLDSNGGSGVNLTISTLSGAATPVISSLIDLSSNAGNSITVSAMGTNAANAKGVLMLGAGANSRAALIVRDTGGYGFATLSGATSGTIGRLTSGTTLDASTAGNNTINYFLASAGTLTRTAALDYSTLTIDSSAGAVTLALGTNSISSGGLGRALLVVGNNDVSITGTGSFAASSAFIYNYGQGTLSMSQGSTASAMEFGGPGLIDYSGTFITTMGTGVGFTGGIGRLSKAQDLTAVTTTHFYVGGGVLEIGADLNGAAAGDFSNPIATSGNKYIQFVGDSGLSAYGVNRVVNFGGAGAQITWGSTGFLTNTDGTTDGGYTFKLSSTKSNAAIEVQNAIALGTNTTRIVDVSEGSAAIDAILSGVLSGSGASLTKAGAGTLSLTGNNTYTGTTMVTAGTLILSGGGVIGNGAVAVNGGQFTVNGAVGNGGVTVASGATLRGNGTIGGTTVVSGTINPGDTGPGTLNTAAQTWLGGGSYVWKINNATGIQGTNWDFLNGSGTLDISTLSPSSKFTINLIGLTGGNVSGAVPNWNNAVDQTWKIGTFASITGTFNAADFNVDASGFTNNNPLIAGGVFGVSNVGNDLYVSYTTPEPSTWALLAFSLITVIVGRRRRTE